MTPRHLGPRATVHYPEKVDEQGSSLRRSQRGLATRNLIRASATRPGLVSIDDLVTEPAGTDDHRSPVEAEVIRRADLRRIGATYRTLPRAFAIPLYLAAVEGVLPNVDPFGREAPASNALGG